MIKLYYSNKMDCCFCPPDSKKPKFKHPTLGSPLPQANESQPSVSRDNPSSNYRPTMFDFGKNNLASKTLLAVEN
jgi:hypothetical protein